MQTPTQKGAPQDLPAPPTNGYVHNPSHYQTPDQKQKRPQTVPNSQDSGIENENEYEHEITQQQVESLEQALALQITKRIEAENLVKSLRGQIQTQAQNQTQTQPKPDESLNHLLKDLQELTDAFVTEVDALDGDETEEKMERRDVLWMLKEVHLRVTDATSMSAKVTSSTNTSVSAANENSSETGTNSNDTVNQRMKEEMDVAILQGEIAQLKETNHRLQQHQNGNGFAASGSKSKSAHSANKQNYKALQEKYARLESRHGNIMKDMQESLNEKIQEITQLKKELGAVRSNPGDATVDLGVNVNANANAVASPARSMQEITSHPTPPHAQVSPTPNIMTTPSPIPTSTTIDTDTDAIHQEPKIDPLSPMSPFFASPHKDLQIASLQEEIEERNQVIDELSSELDGLVAKTNVQSMEADKVKIRYLESIVKDLEGKLKREQLGKVKAKVKSKNDRDAGSTPARNMNRNGNGSEMEDSRNDSNNETMRVSSPTYGSMGWDMGNMGWGASCSNLVGEKFNLAPGAMQSSMIDDMELKIAELMERLREAEEENSMLKEKNSMIRNSGIKTGSDENIPPPKGSHTVQ